MPVEASFIPISKIVRALGLFHPQPLADKVAVEQAILALKTIYFFQTEVMLGLEAIENREDISRAEAGELAAYFRDPTPEVRLMLDLIEPRRFSGNLRLDLEDQETLDHIRYGKLSARREISILFGRYADGDRDDLSLVANRIRAQILKLNNEIAKLERLLKRRISRARFNDVSPDRDFREDDA